MEGSYLADEGALIMNVHNQLQFLELRGAYWHFLTSYAQIVDRWHELLDILHLVTDA